jgi:hypothetical protein
VTGSVRVPDRPGFLVESGQGPFDERRQKA